MSKIKVKHYGAMKHCVFGDCVSDNRFNRPGFDPDTTFYSFPKPCLEIRKIGFTNYNIVDDHLKNCSHCRAVATWVKCCKSKTVSSLANVTKDTYICDRHFLKKFNSIKDINIHSILPASFLEVQQQDKVLKNLNRSSLVSTFIQTGGETGPWNESAECLLNARHVDIINQGNNPPSVSAKDVACQTTFTFKDEELCKEEIKLLKRENHMLQKDCNAYKLKIAKLEQKKKRNSKMCEFEEKIRSNSKMCKFYTGMVFEQIEALLLFLGMIEGVTAVLYWGSSKASTNRRPHQYSFKQELILTLTRLRTGLLVEDLAYRFERTHSYVCKIFTTWVQLMFHKFNDLRPYMFPSRDMISATLPPSFNNLRNIRVIIDCAEIFCQSPSNFEHQGNLYSHYKAHTTFKVLLGCTPSGAVSFVSELFEGSISDREIVQRANLLDLLDEGDLILADRGFTVKDLTDEKNVTLNIPAFLKGRDRLTAEEEVQTKIIAKQRIYIEHVVSRLKRYRLLKKVIPLNMRGIISQIVFVCACLLNFEQPYIK